MKVAFSKPTLGSDEQALLFSSFMRLGYDSLQLKPGQYQDFLNRPMDFLDLYALPRGSLSGLITASRLDQAGIDHVRAVIQFAAAVEAERVVFCQLEPRNAVTNADLETYAAILAELAHEARQLGVALSLHPHYGQPVTHRVDFDTFFSAACGEVSLTVDTAHLVKSGVEDVVEVITSFREVIDNLHFKDYGRGEWQLLGEGEIPFDPIFAAIRDINFDGWVCADEESENDLIYAMHQCRAFIAAGISADQAL